MAAVYRTSERRHFGPVKPGPGIPRDISDPPHLVSRSIPDAAKINKVLQHSMRVQGGSTDSGMLCILSNACLMTSGLVNFYLRRLGVDSQIVVGVMTAPNLGFATPHVWLEVGGEKINTSFVYDPDGDDFPLRMIAEGNMVRGSPEESAKRLYLGEDGAGGVSEQQARMALQGMLMHGSESNFGKAFSFGVRFGMDGLILYHEEMQQFLRDAFGITDTDLQKEWQSKCWGCLTDKSEEDLKTCQGCKVARYCGAECQRADWKEHKKQHKSVQL